MANKNITMREKTSSGYDVLYPKTVTSQIEGILGIEQGGTGVETIEDLINLLSNNGTAKIEVASYTGTGTFGVNNPSSITFGFAPKMVFAICQIRMTDNKGYQFFGEARYIGCAVMISDALSTSFSSSQGFIHGTNTGNHGKKSSDGKTFYWYAEEEDKQLNYPGYDYYFLAIG